MSGGERSSEAVIPGIAIAVIACLTALAWGLSYTALRSLAARHGWPEDGPLGWPASAWPLLIDLFMLAAALLAVEAKRQGLKDRYAWGLTIFYSAALVSGNVIPVWGDWLSVATHAAPGATLIAGWHVLLRRLQPRQIAQAEPSRASAPLPNPTPERASAPAQVRHSTGRPRKATRSGLEAAREWIRHEGLDPHSVMPKQLCERFGISDATAGRWRHKLCEPARPEVVA